MTQSTATAETTAEPRRPLKGTRVGTVISDRRDKTRKVVVNYLARHPKYGKFVRRRSTYQVHDQTNQSQNGDTVEIAECRPISKTKSWRLVRIVEAAASRTTLHETTAPLDEASDQGPARADEAE
jgi:small subunit ribosomal protein S17